jgi:hypothetical protein
MGESGVLQKTTFLTEPLQARRIGPDRTTRDTIPSLDFQSLKHRRVNAHRSQTSAAFGLSPVLLLVIAVISGAAAGAIYG